MATAKKETKTKEPITPLEDKVIAENHSQEEAMSEVPTDKEKEEIIEPIKEVVESNIIIPVNGIPIVTDDRTDEEKLLAYIDSRPEGEIKLNDFLKSLFPIAKLNEPQSYLTQQSSKTIKNLLNKLNLNIVNNQHEKLGKHYYDGDKTETQYYNLSTVSVIVKK